MTTGTGSSASRSVAKRLRPELPLIIYGKCKQKIVMEYRVKRQGPNKGRVFYKCPDRDVSFLRIWLLWLIDLLFLNIFD